MCNQPFHVTGDLHDMGVSGIRVQLYLSITLPASLIRLFDSFDLFLSVKFERMKTIREFRGKNKKFKL